MKFFISAYILLLFSSCTKKFLEEKVSSNYELADNLTALASLLNNEDLMSETPVLGEQSADDYYMTEDFYDGLPPIDKNAYLWKKDIFEGKTDIPDWNIPYKQIFACNLALEGLRNITPGDLHQQEWNEIKGGALFLRSYAFFNLLQVFAMGFDSTYADKKNLGIPMPLKANTETIPARSTINETYHQIINDLDTAVNLVPGAVLPSARNKPNKPAVFALLARIYLSMHNYTQARACADSSLHYQNHLIDYNNPNSPTRYPFAAINEEVIYQSHLISTNNVIQGKAIPGTIIDSTLYSYYDSNDLRPKLYFTNGPWGPIYNGGYTGKAFAFSGLATDENYLIRAECNARLDHLDSAMADLNRLLQQRYKTGTAPRYTPASKKETIELILKERRKELIFRGIRWPDIKRLNKEEALKIVPKRSLKGQSYALLPLSNNYALPLPDDALLENVIIQNERE
jgi:hypothetical protein